MKESTTYQAIIAEGRMEGRMEGRTEGRAEEARRILVRLGEKKLGTIDAAAQAALQAIGEVEQLEQLIEKVSAAGSWQELLATTGQPRGKRRRKGKG